MRKDIKSIALNMSAEARDRALQRQIQSQQRGKQFAGQGEYVGYDADSGLHSVQLSDDSIVEGFLITNSGLAPGDRVTVVRSSDSIYATFKAMPR